MCYSHPGKSLTSGLYFQCVHSGYSRQLNELKNNNEINYSSARNKNANIRAKISLLQEAI